jgi:TetR/AcrR family tetracycline transcriptional repressor
VAGKNTPTARAAGESRGPGRPGPGRTLSDEQVVDTALALLDREGHGALSVRAVAAALGVRPNALYTYVADRAALERAVVERVLAEADLELLRGPARSWRRRLIGYAGSLRRALLARPATVPLLMTAPMTGPVALEVGERLLAALEDAGLKPHDAARACWVLIVYVIGSAALDVAETDGRAPIAPEAERTAQRLAGFQAVDPTDFPRTAAANPVMAAWVTTAQFQWGLDRLLAGLVRAH